MTRRYVTNGKTYNRSNNSRNNGRVYYNNNTTNRNNNYGSRNTKKSYSNNRINSRSFNTQPQVKYFGLFTLLSIYTKKICFLESGLENKNLHQPECLRQLWIQEPSVLHPVRGDVLPEVT